MVTRKMEVGTGLDLLGWTLDSLANLLTDKGKARAEKYLVATQASRVGSAGEKTISEVSNVSCMCVGRCHMWA